MKKNDKRITGNKIIQIKFVRGIFNALFYSGIPGFLLMTAGNV